MNLGQQIINITPTNQKLITKGQTSNQPFSGGTILLHRINKNPCKGNAT